MDINTVLIYILTVSCAYYCWCLIAKDPIFANTGTISAKLTTGDQRMKRRTTWTTASSRVLNFLIYWAINIFVCSEWLRNSDNLLLPIICILLPCYLEMFCCKQILIKKEVKADCGSVLREVSTIPDSIYMWSRMYNANGHTSCWHSKSVHEVCHTVRASAHNLYVGNVCKLKTLLI